MSDFYGNSGFLSGTKEELEQKTKMTLEHPRKHREPSGTTNQNTLLDHLGLLAHIPRAIKEPPRKPSTTLNVNQIDS